jgi:hypothetical protein
MKPDLDLQLQVVLRSLQEVVMPAIDPENKPANEQIGVCLHNLNIVRSRIPYQRRFVRAELRDSIGFIEQIIAVLKDSEQELQQQLKNVVSEAAAALADADIDTAELSDLVSSLRTLTSQSLQQLASHPDYGVIERLGIELSEIQLSKARAWFINCGIESAPEQLPSLDDAI